MRRPGFSTGEVVTETGNVAGLLASCGRSHPEARSGWGSGFMPKAGTYGRLLAVIAAGAVLAACGGNPEPKVDAKSPKPKASTKSASPTPTPPSPSATPGEAPERTFTRHYFELVDYARQTGDVVPMLDASSPKCQSCTGVADVINQIFKSGGHYEGDYKVQIKEINGSGGVLNMVASMGPFRVTGAKAKNYPKEQKFYDVELKRQGDRWIMYGYAIAE
jgi:uncharacterized protein DUF6318